MGVRKFLNDYSGLVAVLALVVMIGALWQAFFGGSGGRTYVPPTEVYFYDLVGGKLFVASVKDYPPIDNPEGTKLKNGQPAGVKANVFSCGSCKEGEWQIGYLETYQPKARDAQMKMDAEMEKLAAAAATNPEGGPGMPALTGPNPEYMRQISEGHMVARVKAPTKWFKMEEPEGAQIVNEGVTKCPDGKYPTPCYPGR
jgi:hypothetical protein